MVRNNDTARQLLDIAQELIQKRGFNAMSFADLAARIAIRTPSIHHHFPTKEALGSALLERYKAALAAAHVAIEDASDDAFVRIGRYVDLFAQTVREGRLCLAGMLAADFDTLTPTLQRQIREVIQQEETWLAEILERGRTAGSLRFEDSAEMVARTLFGGLEGVMLVSRVSGEASSFSVLATRLVSALVRS